ERKERPRQSERPQHIQRDRRRIRPSARGDRRRRLAASELARECERAHAGDEERDRGGERETDRRGQQNREQRERTVRRRLRRRGEYVARQNVRIPERPLPAQNRLPHY